MNFVEFKRSLYRKIIPLNVDCLPWPAGTEPSAILEEAYAFCKSIYGEPPDAEIPTDMNSGMASLCIFDSRFALYRIMLDRRIAGWEELLQILGHEMYHRISAWPLAKSRDHLKEELLATLTSEWFLISKGFEEHVLWKRTLLEHYSKERVDFEELRHVKPRTSLIDTFRGTVYPEGYGIKLQRLATAIETIVPRPQLVRLHHESSVQGWITELPDAQRSMMKHLLQLPCDDPLPTGYKDLATYGMALIAVGRPLEAIEALLQAGTVAGSRSEYLYSLAAAYCDERLYEQARETWETYLRAKPNDMDTLYSLAFVCREMNQLDDALVFINQIMSIDQNNAIAHNELAEVHLKKGDVNSARREWEYVIETAGSSPQGERAKVQLGKLAGA